MADRAHTIEIAPVTPDVVDAVLALGSRPVYPELQTAAHAVRDHHRQVEESLRAGLSNALNQAIEAGRKLAYAKSLLNHGEWGPWVEQNLPGISGRTERLYRQLAAAADTGQLANWQTSSNLSIEGALRALTAGSDDDSSRAKLKTQRCPSARQLARQAVRPLQRALSEDSDIEYDELVAALAGELAGAHAVAWAGTLEELFGAIRRALESGEEW
jgi:hypothetical protein